MKKLLVIIMLLAVAGCGKVVSYKVVEHYDSQSPTTIAILPVVGLGGEDEDQRLIRNLVFNELVEKNYEPMALDKVDAIYRRLLDKKVEQLTPAEATKLFGTDAILYTRVTEWDTSKVMNYASFELALEFKLYSSSGAKLWIADHETVESDIRLDTNTMQLAVFQAYEPRVQRIIDLIFLTLPSKKTSSGQKTYFDWLE